MATDDIDDGFFPAPSVLGWISIMFGIVGIAAVLFYQKKVSIPPRNDLYGCYEARGGPDIEISPTTLTVRQPMQIRIASKLIYIKGWSFEIGHWLEVRPLSADRFEIAATWPDGEYLRLVPEGAIAPPIAQFTLYSRTSNLAVVYRKTGQRCS